MRILGFSKKWDKLNQPEFTTFRFPRKDKDWQVDERVRIVYKPRSKGGGEELGEAIIVGRAIKWVVIWWSGQWGIAEEEAQKDGFRDRYDMKRWLEKAYGIRYAYEPMNKLTLRWVNGNNR